MTRGPEAPPDSTVLFAGRESVFVFVKQFDPFTYDENSRRETLLRTAV